MIDVTAAGRSIPRGSTVLPLVFDSRGALGAHLWERVTYDATSLLTLLQLNLLKFAGERVEQLGRQPPWRAQPLRELLRRAGDHLGCRRTGLGNFISRFFVAKASPCR